MSTSPDVYESESAAIYNRSFWLAYGANMSLVAANTMTFRFAEFVDLLKGTKTDTGWIVGLALAGSLISRFWLGQAIDRFGVRKLWLVGSALFLVGCAGLWSTHALGTQIYLARAAYQIGISAMFVCSNLHIQLRVPPHRRTEAIGSLGSSGFVGMIVGAQLVDLLFDRFSGPELFETLFAGTIGFGILYIIFVLLLTHTDMHVRPEVTPPAHVLVRRYWPGPVVLVSLMMGLGFSVTMVFLTRLATERHLDGVRYFFTGYAVAAFSVRLLTRTWSRTMGRRSMILLGLVGHAIGHAWLIFVQSEAQFIGPALCIGFGHALLFPCVVSLG
ncbi:MAG: MFS transporter, partial [Planctomycetota bacterium]